MVFKDIQLPFSNSYQVNELINTVPVNEKIVTDYWCVNAISAFSNKKLYCIEIDREITFLVLNNQFNTKVQGVYLNSRKKLFEKEGLKNAYLISTYSPQMIFKFNEQLEKTFTPSAPVARTR